MKPRRTRSGAGSAHDNDHAHGAGDRGRRAAQVVRRPVVLDGIDLYVAEGHDLRAARPERRRQDHDGADPVHADPRRRRRGARRRPRRGPRTRTRSGRRSASPASSPRWTTCSPARRTCCLMADLHHLDRAEGRRRAAELLERFDLVDAARKTAATYSGGMRRRLDLAMSLVGDPRIIFLDEPTTGLDPRSRRTMWQIIRDLVAGGVTIFLTTQYLEEADQLADRIAVLDHGQARRRGHRRRAQATGPRRAHPAAVRRRRGRSTRPPPSSARCPATTRRSALQVPERRRRPVAAGAARPARRRMRSRSTNCPCTPPISTTSSSPSPAAPTRREGDRPMTTMSYAVDATRRRCCAATCGTCCATRP